jgi:hypothetical protein
MRGFDGNEMNESSNEPPSRGSRSKFLWPEGSRFDGSRFALNPAPSAPQKKLISGESRILLGYSQGDNAFPVRQDR